MLFKQREVLSVKKSKTLFFIFLVVIVSSFIIPLLVAHADSPPPPNYFYSYVTNTNSNAKYTDILIKISKNSKYYTGLNTSNAQEYGFNSSTPIVNYNKDGYMSICFHCNDVSSMPSILQNLDMCKTIELENGYKPISTMTDSIKIALFDKSGNVLKVSDAVSVMPTVNDTYPNEVNYDASSTIPIVNFVPFYKGYANNAVILLNFFVFAFLIRMAISTTTETLIAIPFKIRPLWKIVVINIATQILLFAFISSGRLSYNSSILIGEIFVFIFEFVAYIFLFKNISKPKLALYTVIANTISLVIGLIFNGFHIFVG